MSIKRDGWDRSRIFFVGTSAGGHLAAFVAQMTPETAGLIALSGMYDLVNKGDSLFGRSRVFLKGTTEQEWRHGSPIQRMRTPPVPSLLLHGEQDPVIDRQQAIDFASAIQKAGGDAEACILPGIGHAVPMTVGVSEKIDAFVEKYSAPTKPGSLHSTSRKIP